MGTVLLGINPFGTFVTTVVTRTLEGFLTGFKGLHSINGVKKFSYYIASLCCPLLNTLLFMSSLVLFFYNTDYAISLLHSELRTTYIRSIICWCSGTY